MNLEESEILEFKKSTSESKEALISIVAILNKHQKGELYFGINKKGDIVGLDIGEKTLRDISKTISDHIEPKIYPKIEKKTIKNKNCIKVDFSGKNIPYYAYGRAYIRVADEDRLMSAKEVERLILEKNKEKLYWDKQICKDAGLEDIDKEKVKWFLKKAKYERNFDIDSRTSVKEALKRLKLIKNEKLTNAAILLFGKDPQKFFLQAKIRCARFKGVTAIDFIDMKLIEGNIIDQINKTENFVLSHIKKAAKIVMFKREEAWEYPLDALREAIVNAVCHRNYFIQGNIKIAIFDDRIEMSDPGQLPEPLTPSMLKKKHDSILRNPLIANSFFLIKNIEQWGKGTNKIVKWCTEYGLKEPDFKEIGGGFEVIFYAPKDIMKLIPEKGKIDLIKLGLSERQIEALKLMVNGNKKFTIKEYANIFKISKKTAKRDMKKLVETGYVNKKGVKKGAYFEAK